MYPFECFSLLSSEVSTQDSAQAAAAEEEEGEHQKENIRLLL